MSTQMIPYSSIVEVSGENQSKNLKENISNYIYHWPLFVMCIITALSGSFLYGYFTDNIYEIKAKILINDERRFSGELPALKELDLFEKNKLVDNEVEVLKSRELVQEVVKDLNIGIAYFKPRIKSNNELYSDSPVKLTIFNYSGILKNGETFTILIKNQNSYTLERENGEIKEAFFGRVMENNLGFWKLDTKESIKNFIGQKIQISVQNPEEAVEEMLSNLKVDPLNKLTSVVELSLKDNVRQRGIDILNRLIDRYNKASKEEKNNITKSTLNFIDERLASISSELNKVEKNVEGFRSSQGLTDITSEARVFLDNVQSNDGRLNEVNVQLKVLEGIDSYVNSSENIGNVPATLGISDPALTDLITNLSQLQLQRERLLAITPEGNPVFNPINNQIRIIKSSIKENVQGIKSSLLTIRNKLNSYNTGYENSIRKLPGQERQLVDIQRQQSIKENLYIHLLQKREEVALSYASNLSVSQVVEHANSSIVPVSPKKVINNFLALIFGVSFPIGLIYGRNLLNNRIINRSDIESITSVPIVNEVMYEPSKSAIVVNETNNFAIGEQFRSLRTNLHYLHNKKDRGRVTLLTSSISNEGKSFVTNNLGMALAAVGRKTVILELDLRKPQILKTLNLPVDEVGLTDYIKGLVSREDIIQSSGIHENLDIIGTGPLPKNPSELLEGEKINLLIDWLKDRYDDILIDSPPLHLVTDAIILSRLSNVTLYIIRHNYTPKSELDFVDRLNKENKLPKLNLVFNGVQMHRRYGYYVDSGYYTKTSQKSKLNDFMNSLGSRF